MRPTDVLREEHRAIERALSALETVAQRVQNGEPMPIELIRDLLQFIRQFADQCHHCKEEQMLFPAMERRGFPAKHGPIAIMLSEHEEGRAHVRGLLKSIERYERKDPTVNNLIVSHSLAFASLLRSHIQKEDNVLFVMAEQHLAEQDQEELSAGFRRVEQAGEACSRKSELLTLLTQIEQKLHS